MDTAETRPTVRLRPKTDPRPLRHGFPWVFADQLVTDRRTRALAPGTLAVLEDAERRPIGLCAVNPASKIIARLLDLDPGAEIGVDWFRSRLATALAMRERVYPGGYYRLVHAEADGLPGVIVDRFGAAAVIQPNAAWCERLLEPLAEALIEVSGCTTLVKNASGRARAQEALDSESSVLSGRLEGPVEVPMNGASYIADLAGGQKTGLYYDQRENHAFAAGLAAGGRVLDVFAHVGGFSLAALAKGAAFALAVDSSAQALELAEAGARATGVAERFATRREDAFSALEALGGAGERFDLVICDPPAFAPSKSALDAGLRAYQRVARLAAPLVAPGGYLVLCSCSHAADLERFRAASVRGIGRAGRCAQIIRTGFAGPDHPLHPQLAQSGYLKAVSFRILP